MKQKNGAVVEATSGTSFEELNATMTALLKKRSPRGRFVIQLRNAPSGHSNDETVWLKGDWKDFREKFYGNGSMKHGAVVSDLSFHTCGKRIEGVFA